MNTSFLIIDKFTLKNLIYENHFQVKAHWNRLVQPPHTVIKNTISIIYYTMNQKSIDGTSDHYYTTKCIPNKNSNLDTT